MPFSIEPTDFLTIGLLVLLEAVLSADNALVLAVLVLPLPQKQQKRALQYGIFGAFAFRIIATLFAVHLMSWAWIKLAGGAYLLYLPLKHFSTHPDQAGSRMAVIKPLLGLTIFWSTVVRVEFTDIVFAIDSILVAVAMSPKVWVVITGGLLGSSSSSSTRTPCTGFTGKSRGGSRSRSCSSSSRGARSMRSGRKHLREETEAAMARAASIRRRF